MKKVGRNAERVGVRQRERVPKDKGLWALHVRLGTEERTIGTDTELGRMCTELGWFRIEIIMY